MKLLLLPFLLIATSCTTTGKFKIPEGTKLEVYERPVEVSPSGMVTTKPFFWTAAGIPPSAGIKYKLTKGNDVVKEGRLRAKFRVVSIFWPPMALIYWPMGFNPDIIYDLVNDTQE